MPRGAGGRPRNRTNLRPEEEILDEVEREPTTSGRRVARQIGCSETLVNRVLRAEKLHPYHYTPVQNIHDGDEEIRMQFCQRFLQLNDDTPELLSHILWTDESPLTGKRIFNQHNLHFYADGNPHLTVHKSSQEHCSVNIWDGISGDQ
uniref:Transposase Tc1-like domain-containing protein n=1 Tax=Bracon brevicornis TaxID=1563983 RepID=A0A6V7INM3_9HYME